MDPPAQRRGRDGSRALPEGFGIGAGQRAVAGEGELASGCALGPLEHHAAHAFGESGMADAVEHDLCYCLLPAPVVARFVEHRGGEAVGGAGAVFAGPGKAERACGRVGAGHERDRCVERARIVGIDRLKLDRLYRREFGALHDALGRADLSRDLSRDVRRIGGDQQW